MRPPSRVAGSPKLRREDTASREADGPSNGSQPVGNYAVLPLRNPAAAHR
jgi:hypothetical protein